MVAKATNGPEVNKVPMPDAGGRGNDVEPPDARGAEAPDDEPSKDRAAQADPFDDLSQWRVRTDFRTTGGVKKTITEVAVGKPGKQEFVWVHPDPAYRMDVAVIERESDRAIYLVHPDVADDLAKWTKPVTLYTTQNTQGVTYLWAVSMPQEGSSNSWTDSAHDCAATAMNECIQVYSNTSPKAKRYEPVRPLNPPPPPEWPDLTLNQLMKLAFGSRYITTLDHPVAEKLRGVKF